MPKITFSNRNNEFYQSLKIAVDEYFEKRQMKKTGDWRLFSKTIILISAAVTGYVLLMFFNLSALPALLICAVMGYLFACLGFNVMHDANHGSYCSKPMLNDLIGLSANALGASAFFWKQKHNILHHTYTNLHDIDEDITKIVPGDIIRLSVGDLVPADVRILSAKDLFINQSSLTGESLPIEKYQYPLYSKISSPFDWNNLAFMGSHVVSGMGTALVLKTGNSSFFGEMTNEISIDKKKTTFDEGVNQFTWLMIRLMFAMIPSVFLINGLIKGDWLEAALFAIAVGVGLAPEMLPMIVTVNLAKGAISLSKNKVIIKRLTAVQNLGAMNILCADKTGTLTQNEIILEKHIDINGNDSKGVLEYAYLNSHYQTGLKNAMDLAILKHIDVHEFLHDKNNYQKIDEIPFDFERRRLSIIIRKNNSQDILICKGAVEEVYSCCQFVQIGDERVALTNQHKINIKTVVDTLNSDGFRVLAIAIHEEASSERVYKIPDESELTLIGYIAFLDPPKESAMAAIKALQDCGIKIKILTGDNELITRRICQQVGLTINSSIAGSRIDGLNDEQILEVSLRHTIFYKMTPHQKARVINALRMQNNVVGYLGDGINDGPALKAAWPTEHDNNAAMAAARTTDCFMELSPPMASASGWVNERDRQPYQYRPALRQTRLASPAPTCAAAFPAARRRYSRACLETAPAAAGAARSGYSRHPARGRARHRAEPARAPPRANVPPSGRGNHCR